MMAKVMMAKVIMAKVLEREVMWPRECSDRGSATAGMAVTAVAVRQSGLGRARQTQHGERRHAGGNMLQVHRLLLCLKLPFPVMTGPVAARWA
jgi:hypothetical protein